MNLDDSILSSFKYKSTGTLINTDAADNHRLFYLWESVRYFKIICKNNYE